jgi:hypothetical protein
MDAVTVIRLTRIAGVHRAMTVRGTKTGAAGRNSNIATQLRMGKGLPAPPYDASGFAFT